MSDHLSQKNPAERGWFEQQRTENSAMLVLCTVCATNNTMGYSCGREVYIDDHIIPRDRSQVLSLVEGF